MGALERMVKSAIFGFLAVSLVAPFPVWSGSTSSLGTVSGVRAARLSIDGGKTWLAVTGRALPVLDGAELRTTGGSAVLDLSDGSRFSVLPFSAVQFRETNGMSGLSILHGRLIFRVPADTRVEILTPVAQLTPVRQGPMVGEVFVGSDGLTGLKMAEGSLQVKQMAGERRTILASLEPVFLPRRPATSGAFFSTDPLPPVPADARGVFTPSGESVGYLGPDGKLVIHPGFTNDLTRPFPPELVQPAMAKIVENDRNHAATPLFDVNGGYVGYLSGPIFYAHSSQPTSEVATTRGLSGATGAIGAIGAIGAGSVAGVGVGIAAGAAASTNLVGPMVKPASKPCPPRNPHCPP